MTEKQIIISPNISSIITCFVCDKECNFNHTLKKGKPACLDCVKIIPFEWREEDNKSKRLTNA